MNLLNNPNPALLWLCSALAAPILLAALWRAPWAQVNASHARQHALFATVLALAVFWLLQVEVRGALGFHPLLMTVTTMVFGGPLALLIGAAALVVLPIYRLAFTGTTDTWAAAWGDLTLQTLPVDFCLSVAVPVAWACAVIWLVDHWRFKNPFTYFLGVGFFGAMTSCLWIGAAAMALFGLTGSEGLVATTREHSLLFALMMFPEGFCNGMIATVLTVLYPDLVKTYRDDWYIDGNNNP